MVKPLVIVSAALAVMVLVFAQDALASQDADTERLLRTITPPLEIIEEKIEKKDEWYVDCYYEPSEIVQNSRTGHWNELTTTYGYIHKNIHGYMVVSQLERFDARDFNANFGSYLSFKDYYAHLEIAFGWDVTYIYRLQTIAEYGHKLYKTLFWQIGYNYRAYPTNDVHLVLPGLIYYFGDSYMGAFMGVGYMEANDTSYFGSLRGSFALTKFLKWDTGISFGERLYDIYTLDAREEQGYIIFTGLTYNLYKGINLRAGYIYGKEHPNFVKRSLYFSASVKF